MASSIGRYRLLAQEGGREKRKREQKAMASSIDRYRLLAQEGGREKRKREQKGRMDFRA